MKNHGSFQGLPLSQKKMTRLLGETGVLSQQVRHGDLENHALPKSHNLRLLFENSKCILFIRRMHFSSLSRGPSASPNRFTSFSCSSRRSQRRTSQPCPSQSVRSAPRCLPRGVRDWQQYAPTTIRFQSRSSASCGFHSTERLNTFFAFGAGVELSCASLHVPAAVGCCLLSLSVTGRTGVSQAASAFVLLVLTLQWPTKFHHPWLPESGSSSARRSVAEVLQIQDACAFCHDVVPDPLSTHRERLHGEQQVHAMLAVHS